MRGIKYRRGSRRWKRQMKSGNRSEDYLLAGPYNKPTGAGYEAFHKHQVQK